MLLTECATHYIGYLFMSTVCMMSAVKSRVIPDLENQELNTLFLVHKPTMELHENKPERSNNMTNRVFNDQEINVSVQFQTTRIPKQQHDTTNKKTPLILLLWKLFFRMFYSETAVHVLKKMRRETDFSQSVTDLSSENYKFKDAHLQVSDLKRNNLANENTDTDLHQIRHRRHSFSTPSEESTSKHLIPQIENESSVTANMTFFRNLIHKVTLEADIKHSAQVAFLCLAGLCCLMTWTVWYNGMCRNRTLNYVYWDRQKTITTDIRDILYQRRKYLPLFEDEQYDVVYVEDKGTDP